MREQIRGGLTGLRGRAGAGETAAGGVGGSRGADLDAVLHRNLRTLVYTAGVAIHIQHRVNCTTVHSPLAAVRHCVFRGGCGKGRGGGALCWSRPSFSSRVWMSLHLRQAVPSGISFLTIVMVRIGTAGAGWALLKPCGPASKCSCTASQNSSGHSPPCLAAVAAGAEAKGRASHMGLAGLALCGRRAARARASVGGRIAATVAEPLRAAPPRGASRAAVGHIFPEAERSGGEVR